MDDEEEFIQLNLSSRPLREERRKQRERERLEREMAGGPLGALVGWTTLAVFFARAEAWWLPLNAAATRTPSGI